METIELTPEQQQALYENCKAMSAYTRCLFECMDLLKSVHEDMTVEELTSIRNRILCRDSFDSAFIGTIGSEPTVTLEELKLRETTENGATMLHMQRTYVRNQALALVN